MPLYEFECTECEARFERLTTFSDADAMECTRCGAPARRLLSVIAGMSGRASAPVPECGAGACGTCS